jgi:transposase
MGLGLSMDLRRRVIAAIEDEGMSCRQAAVRFGVAPSTAIRWHARLRQTGDFAPKPQGGDKNSHRIEAQAGFILGLWEEQRDITLVEVQRQLAERGTPVGIGTVHRFFQRHGITRKKRPGTPSSRTARTS